MAEEFQHLTDAELHASYKGCDETKYPEKASALRKEVIRRAQLRRQGRSTTTSSERASRNLKSTTYTASSSARYNAENLSRRQYSRESYDIEATTRSESDISRSRFSESYSPSDKLTNRLSSPASKETEISRPLQSKSEVNSAETQNTVEKTITRNWFVRYWQGDITLGLSYWLIGVVLSFILVISFLYTQSNVGHSSATATQRGALIIFEYAFFFCVLVWQKVGLFRCALKHKSRGGKTFWAVIVHLTIAFSVGQYLYNMKLVGVPIIKDAMLMVAGKHVIPEYRIKLLNNNTEIEFSGGIRFSATESLKAVLDDHPDISVLHLNSVGGRLVEAEKMAKFVQNYALDTLVTNQCLSSCPIVFMAGYRSMLGAEGQLGFHSTSIGGVSGTNIAAFNASLANALVKAKLKLQFIQKILSVSSEEMWYPTREEMQEGNLRFTEVDAGKFGISGLPDNWPTSELEQELKQNSLYLAIADSDPDSFSHLVTLFHQGGVQGTPLNKTLEKVRHFVYQTKVPYYHGHASDEALYAYANEYHEKLKSLAAKDPKLCAIMANSEDFTLEELLEAQVPMEFMVSATTTSRLIRSVSSNHKFLPEEELELVQSRFRN